MIRGWFVVMTLGYLIQPTTCAETPFYPDKTKLLLYPDAEGKEQPVRTPTDWARGRSTSCSVRSRSW